MTIERIEDFEVLGYLELMITVFLCRHGDGSHDDDGYEEEILFHGCKGTSKVSYYKKNYELFVYPVQTAYLCMRISKRSYSSMDRTSLS